MTNTQEKILEVFKKHKVPVNGILKPQSINFRTWDRRSQDEFQISMNELIEEGYVSVRDNWYVLEEKGYRYIYRNYSIEDTKKIILDVFRKHKVGVGEILMSNHFITTQQNAERFHFDNFNSAMQDLIADGLIEFTDKGYYMLTQLGYDNIY